MWWTTMEHICWGCEEWNVHLLVSSWVLLELSDKTQAATSWSLCVFSQHCWCLAHSLLDQPQAALHTLGLLYSSGHGVDCTENPVNMQHITHLLLFTMYFNHNKQLTFPYSAEAINRLMSTGITHARTFGTFRCHKTIRAERNFPVSSPILCNNSQPITT